MAASKIVVSQGVGTNLATHEITETALQVHLSRTVLNTEAGVTILPLTDAQLRATAINTTTTDTTASGTITALNGTLIYSVNGISAVAIQITGTWVATLQFEATLDGTNWNIINAVSASTSSPQPTTTANGLYRLTPAGASQIRVISTAFTSGSVALIFRGSMAVGGTFMNQIVPTTIISNPPEGVVSVVNSSVVNLAANAVFTGTAEDVTIYSNIKVNVYSSHASALNGLSYQQSHDGTVWFLMDSYTIPATTQKTFSTSANMKFFRLVYTNGATLTSQLIIQTLYHKSDKQPSSVRPQDARDNDNDFVETLGFLMGYNGTSWDRVRTALKNVQSANALATQDLKDSGRSHVTFYSVIPVLSTATDTLQSLTATRAGATVTATTTPAVVSAGKTFRVTKMSASYVATTTSGYAMVRFRFNNAGLVAITSPVSTSFTVGSDNPATANAGYSVEVPFSEGMEFAAGTGVGFSVQGFAAVTPTAVGYVLVSVIGFEY